MNGSLVALFSSLTIREFRPSLLDCFKYRANRKRRLVPDPRTIMGDEAEVYIYIYMSIYFNSLLLVQQLYIVFVTLFHIK